MTRNGSEGPEGRDGDELFTRARLVLCVLALVGACALVRFGGIWWASH